MNYREFYVWSLEATLVVDVVREIPRPDLAQYPMNPDAHLCGIVEPAHGYQGLLMWVHRKDGSVEEYKTPIPIIIVGKPSKQKPTTPSTHPPTNDLVKPIEPEINQRSTTPNNLTHSREDRKISLLMDWTIYPDTLAALDSISQTRITRIRDCIPH